MWGSPPGSVCSYYSNSQITLLFISCKKQRHTSRLCVSVFGFQSTLIGFSTQQRFWFSLFFSSVVLCSWSEVHFPSSSSQQSTLQNINTGQWRSPLWITAAVRLINRSEDFLNPKLTTDVTVCLKTLANPLSFHFIEWTEIAYYAFNVSLWSKYSLLNVMAIESWRHQYLSYDLSSRFSATGNRFFLLSRLHVVRLSEWINWRFAVCCWWTWKVMRLSLKQWRQQ